MGDQPKTIREGLVPQGPLDTYNGVKVSSFCMECRDALARYGHGMQLSVTLCPDDSRKVARAAQCGRGTISGYEGIRRGDRDFCSLRCASVGQHLGPELLPGEMARAAVG